MAIWANMNQSNWTYARFGAACCWLLFEEWDCGSTTISDGWFSLMDWDINLSKPRSFQQSSSLTWVSSSSSSSKLSSNSFGTSISKTSL